MQQVTLHIVYYSYYYRILVSFYRYSREISLIFSILSFVNMQYIQFNSVRISAYFLIDFSNMVYDNMTQVCYMLFTATCGHQGGETNVGYGV